jgi:hypothetical protein
MHDRIQRYVIPATVVLMVVVMTIWLGAKATGTGSLWRNLLDAGNAGMVAAVIALGVTNYGLGYVCHAIFCFVMFHCQKERLVSTKRLLNAFRLTTPDPGGKVTRKQFDAILGEFHLRLHSRASASLREHCTRRNSAWYITKTCVIAIAMGFLVGVVYAWKSPNLVFNWPGLIIWALLLVIFGCFSWKVGTRWNREFWEVAWNWVERDVREQPLSADWLTSHGFTVQPQSDEHDQQGA